MNNLKTEIKDGKGLVLLCPVIGILTLLIFPLFILTPLFADFSGTYKIVDTGQQTFYNNKSEIRKPGKGGAYYGQDAQYPGQAPAYRDNGDGTVTDLNTGLMWQQGYIDDITFAKAKEGAKDFTLAGHDDWRMPTIKELYSLILFSGTDPHIELGARQNLKPFIDTDYFDFRYGDTTKGERIIEAQYWSSTEYRSTTINGNKTAFGVNFADGRIKGYPSDEVGPPHDRHIKKAFVRYVRGNPAYGQNRFVDNGDGTISDLATGLIWTKADSQKGMDWQAALAYAENLELAGHDDWRLPDAKELQSIVDYNRAPATDASAAIDPIFKISTIRAEGGNRDYPYFWSSTTHAQSNGSGQMAVYLSFGTAYGYMAMPPWSKNKRLLDVHGAGAQRCDVKAGDPAKLPKGRGPQGDVMRINNYVRAVRTME